MAIPDLRDKRVVITGAASGIGLAPSMSAYAASKHAVVGLSEVLAMELHGTPIAVSIVAPGVIATNILNARGNISPSFPDPQLKRLQAYYDAHGAQPEVVAEDVVRAVRTGRAVVETGPYARLACRSMRISRRFTRWLTRREAPKLGYL